MNYALPELGMSLLALVSLPAFFLAPGYVAASLTNVFRFREQAWSERLLWATALSQPLSLLLAVHPGLAVSPHATTAGFLLLVAVAFALALRDARRGAVERVFPWDRSATIACFTAAGLVFYCVLASAPVQLHDRLYESAIWQDWSIRIQLVNAAVRGGNHPGNPMFAPGGQPAPLHYYYFWYVLCARMHDLVPVSARAILTASCVGASLSLLAFLLLSLKYLGPVIPSLRRGSVALLLGVCILGLDLLPWGTALALHRTYSNLQFWLSDRSPGWLHMVLWSPHHIAGLVSCGLGLLLLVYALDVDRKQRVVHTVLAAICFAASAGTSTFITLLFASACVFVLLDALWRRQWPTLICIVSAGVLALVLDASFLHNVLLTPSAASRPGVHTARLLVIGPRYAHQSLQWVRHGIIGINGSLFHRQVDLSQPAQYAWTQRLLRPPVAFVLFVLDFGFFAPVLLAQIRKDLLSSGPMSRRARLLWLIFAGVAIPGCLLNSAGLQDNNDLGRHAGLCMHYILLLWAIPLLDAFLQGRPLEKALGLSTSWTRSAVAFAVLGILGQGAQIILDRIQMPLSDGHILPQVVVAERVPQAARRFAQIEQAMSAAAHVTAPLGIVQGNPHSRFNAVMLFYTDRQMAASDDGCNTPFGGDPRWCVPVATALIELFGGFGRHFQGASSLLKRIDFDPDMVTSRNFARVCAQYHLDTLVANYGDPVWQNRQSWVWLVQPEYANGGARVFRCPFVALEDKTVFPPIASTP